MPLLDLAPPVAIHSEPIHLEQNVPLNKDIVATFNEPIKPGNGYILLSNGEGDTRRIAVHDGSQVTFYNNTGKYGMGGYNTGVVTINPRENLLSNSSYYVQVETGVITDMAGNPLPGVTDNTSYRFETSADSIFPIALSTSPINHSENFSVMGEITATFNEPVIFQGGIGEIVVTDEQGDIRPMKIRRAGNSISFNLYNTLISDSLLPNTQYFLKVPFGAITDLAGNAFAGVQDRSFGFTTGNGNDDITAPKIFLNQIPQPALVATNIRLLANERIKAGTGKITLDNGQGDVRKISINDQSQVTFEAREEYGFGTPNKYASQYGITVVIKPSQHLLPHNQYTLQVDPSAITDLAGNPFVVQTDGQPGFPPISTGDLDTTPPFAESVNLLSRKHIQLKAQLSALFNEPIQAGSGNIVISNGAKDTRVIPIGDLSQIYVYAGYDFGSINIQLDKKLLPGNRYHVLVDSGAITDLAGNAYAGVQDPKAFTFETESLWAATNNPVVETNRGNSLGVYENKDILTFRFNAPVVNYQSFKLSNHTFGGNDVVLSADGLSASVMLTADSTVAPGDVVTLEGAQGIAGADGITPVADIEFKL